MPWNYSMKSRQVLHVSSVPGNVRLKSSEKSPDVEFWDAKPLAPGRCFLSRLVPGFRVAQRFPIWRRDVTPSCLRAVFWSLDICCSYFFQAAWHSWKIIPKYQGKSGQRTSSNFPSQKLTFQTQWGKQTYSSTFTNADNFSISYLLRTCMSSKTRNNIIHIHHLGVIAILLLGKMFYHLYYQPFFDKSSSHYHQHPMPNLPRKDPK